MLLYIILIIVGFALLIVGADFLVDGASGIAKKFHIPEINTVRKLFNNIIRMFQNFNLSQKTNNWINNSINRNINARAFCKYNISYRWLF